MGLSVPTSLASIAATLALGGGAAAPYEPLPPPLSKSSPAEKPAPPAKPPEFPAPKPDAGKAPDKGERRKDDKKDDK